MEIENKRVYRNEAEDSTAARDNKRSEPPSTAQNVKLGPIIGKAQGDNQKPYKFCNKCGTLIGRKDKTVACTECGMACHTRCIQKKGETIDPSKFVCPDCNEPEINN